MDPDALRAPPGASPPLPLSHALAIWCLDTVVKAGMLAFWYVVFSTLDALRRVVETGGAS